MVTIRLIRIRKQERLTILVYLWQVSTPSKFISERIRFSILVFLKICGKDKKSEKLRNAVAGLLHDCGADFEKDLGGYLAVENSTGGILLRHISAGLERPNPSPRWLLVGEPQGTGKIVKEFVVKQIDGDVEVSELETILGVDWTSQQFQIDLCKPLELSLQLDIPKNFDFIICQSLLEHVVNPIQVLLNLSFLLREGGVISVSTSTPAMQIHRFPIDTLRFNQDFFENVCNYLPLSLVSVERIEDAIIAVFRKVR